MSQNAPVADIKNRSVQNGTGSSVGGTAHPFLEAFSPISRGRLIASLEHQNYSAGENLFREGDPGDAIYLVLEGEIEIVLSTGKQQKIVSIISPGDYFGEVAVLDGRGRSTAARARGAVKVAKVPAIILLEILAEDPGIAALNLFCHSISHLRKSNGLIVEEVVHKEKLSLVGEMASSLMHDLRSPLSCILMSADLLDADRSERNVSSLIEAIRLQCQRISAMAVDLMDFSRGESKLQISSTTTEAFLGQFKKLNEQYLSKVVVRVSFEALPGAIEIDLMRLIRVLQNLLSNAVEALGATPDPRVDVKVWLEDSSLHLTVTDNGPGIPSEIRERIFEPFVTHGKSGGVGLGMAIVRNIVTAHGGTITFQSAAKKGTRFLITIPQKLSHRAPAAARSTRHPTQRTAARVGK